MRHSKRQQMAQDAARKQRVKVERSWATLRGLAAFFFVGMVFLGGYQTLLNPNSPLPSAWNPTRSLVISDPVTPLTGWKLNHAVASFESCLAALDGYTNLKPLDPLSQSEQCYIRDRVALREVGRARLRPLETRCAIALRLAMWERHSLQPAAAVHFGSDVSGITHVGSYNCRPLRTLNGPTSQMSTHATADAIDVVGFDIADGTKIRLIDDWVGEGAKSAFLRDVRDGACKWFSLTLSPDYNQLHADHFHLQSKGWGLCR
jgi:hypothetical protein